MHQSRTLDMGMDVHTDTMAVASVANAHDAEVVFLGTLGTRHGALDPLIRKLPSTATPLIFVDEAGPCGSGLSRSLTHKGDDGWVVAPSLLPKTPGDRGNTDRRDAVPVARLARSGARTVVDVPQVAEEARRDRARAREDPRGELKSATCRLNAFWRRPSSVQKTSGPVMHTPHASSVATKHAQSRSPRGAGRRWSRRGRPGVACRASPP